jgi:hypothetical protein
VDTEVLNSLELYVNLSGAQISRVSIAGSRFG